MYSIQVAASVNTKLAALTLIAFAVGCSETPQSFDSCSTGSINNCPTSPGYDNPYEGQLSLLSWTETLRKASLELTGTLPTAAQIQATEQHGQLGLEASLAEMMRTDAFYDRLIELYNDHFLTDKYLGNRNALNLLDEEVFPNLFWYEQFGGNERELRELTNNSVAREALELIAYVVRNDRPFTEILTADYTVANGYSAPSLIGLPGVPFRVDDDPDRFRKMQLPGVPHAGILTSAMFLNRFPTSDTNVNRHRSRMAYQFFLDIDVNLAGNRPVDANDDFGENPTLNNPQCTVCHVTLDPVAGLFMNWDESGIYDPADGWRDDMLPPGFAGEDLPANLNDRRLRWFAFRLADHPRFAVATVHTIFQGLTGQTPLVNSDGLPPITDLDAGVPDAGTPDSGPDDGGVMDGGMMDAGMSDGGMMDGGATDGGMASDGGADAGALVMKSAATDRALQVQQQIFATMRSRFVAADYSLKALIVEIVLSPYFRAGSALPMSPEMQEELSAFGTARFLTPEHLHRKIQATTGVRWKRNYSNEDYLLNDYLIFYGGIDSDLVIKRVKEPNGVMASLSQRMAYEVSCSAVPYDFSKPAHERLLFPATEIAQLPADDAATRDAIAHLHQQIVGEPLDPNGAEVNATLALLLQSLSLGRAGIANETVDERLAEPCRLWADRNTNKQLPSSRQISRDEQYTMRSWMAVVSYLLSDYRFLYE